MDVKIPKIVMQTWKDRHIPHKWKKSVKSIKKFLPDWKYVLLTDKDNDEFVYKYFPDFYVYFKNFPYGIQRADAIRYMWLYVNGGLYMDLDLVILKPIEELFTCDTELYLVHSSNISMYLTNSIMASKPRSSFWLKMIEEMKTDVPWYSFGKHITVMNSAGPGRLSKVVSEIEIPYTILPKNKILPCSVCNMNCTPENCYFKQLEGMSWVSYDTKIFNFCLCNGKLIVIFLLILLFIFIVWCLL